MKRYILLILLLLLQLSLQAKASQTKHQLKKSPLEKQLLTQSEYTQPDSDLSNARNLLDQSYQSYNSGDFLNSENLARQALNAIQEQYDSQPNFSIPRPGGFRETRFSIPFIFEFYRSYTVPSEITVLAANEKISFDNLFSEIVARISNNLTHFEMSTLQAELLDRFSGCLYYGGSGYHCINRPRRSELEDLVRNNPELREFFSEIFGLETNQNTQSQLPEIDSRNDLHSILKESLHLIQKSLIAQNEDEKAKEALIFAEMSRNTEFVRLAPLVLYGLLNYEAITSNSSYSRFFGSVGLSDLDLDSIRKIASKQDATIVYYSILASESEEDLLIWVIQPSGDITFKRVNLFNAEVPLDSLVNRGFTAAASFIDRGQQETALIQAVRDLRSQGYEYERASLTDFLIDESDQTSRLQALYNILVKPIEELLPTNPDSHVIFVPHKNLTVVPFAVLQDSEGRYVIEKHTIRMAYSLSNLRKLVKPIRKMPTGEEFLAVGNPDLQDLNLTYDDGSRVNLSNLPGADAEVVEVSPSDGYWFRRDAATWDRISSLLEDAEIVHLATHGILNFDNRKEFMLVQLLQEEENQTFHIEENSDNTLPSSDSTYRLWYNQVNPDKSWQVVRANLNLPGAIVLANSVLTANEILSLRMNANLVVLSACNSGRGVPTESGILGLPFALGLAGVPRVVVSQWSVPDTSTRQLMFMYYNAMRENIRLTGEANPAGALRKAMLEIKDDYPDPIYWAGFTGLSILLCQRIIPLGNLSSNSIAKRLRAGFHSRIGIVHFLEIFSIAR